MKITNNEIDPVKKFRVEATDGDSGHGWRTVLRSDDGIYATQEASRMYHSGQYAYSGGVRVIEQTVRASIPQ